MIFHTICKGQSLFTISFEMSWLKTCKTKSLWFQKWISILQWQIQVLLAHISSEWVSSQYTQGFENTLTVFGLPLDSDVLSSSGFDCSFELITKFLCVPENSPDFFCWLSCRVFVGFALLITSLPYIGSVNAFLASLQTKLTRWWNFTICLFSLMFLHFLCK